MGEIPEDIKKAARDIMAQACLPEHMVKNGVHSAIEADIARAILAERERCAKVEDALKTADAWLDRWAVHVGTCPGAEHCTCGLTRVRFEIAATKE